MDLSTFAARVKARRKMLGLTQLQVAERAGMMQSNYNHYETGRVQEPTQAYLRSLARALCCSVRWLQHGAKQHAPDGMYKAFIDE